LDDREIALNKQGLKASFTQSSPIGSEEGQYDPFKIRKNKKFDYQSLLKRYRGVGVL